MSTEPDAVKLDGLNLKDEKTSNGTNPGAATFSPAGPGFKWSDEDDSTPAGTDKKAGGAAKEKSDLEQAQTDGSTPWIGGSSFPTTNDSKNTGAKGLDEPEFDVNVKLADLQEDPNNPLYSVKTFDELNL